MGSNIKAQTSGPSPAAINALLGPAPILSTESAEQFDKVFDQLIVCLKVQDMVEGILIWDFAVPSWEINRYSRHRTVSFDRSFKQSLEFQVQRVKNEMAKTQGLASDIAQQATQSPFDIARLARLEKKVESSATEIQEILKRTPTDLDHSHALEKSISFHKDVEFLITSLTKRRNEALRMLDLYRAGLGKQVDQAMNEILDAEYKVVDEHPQHVQSPSLVPSTVPAVEAGKDQELPTETATSARPTETAISASPTEEEKK